MPPNEGQINRDMEARGANFERYQGMWGAGGANRNQMQQLDTAFRQGRNDRTPQEPYVRYSQERGTEGMVTEFSAEFADRALEKYLDQYMQREQEMQERRYGQGWMGRVRRWFNETDAGKAIKIVGKIGVGVAGVLGAFSSLGFATPVAVALARKYGVDGIGELVQQFWEMPALQEVRNNEQQERTLIIQAMQLRNLMQQQELQNPGTHISPNDPINPGANETYAERWQNIMAQLDQYSQQRAEASTRLDRVRAWGRGIRSVVSTGVAAGSMAYNYTHGGISLGHHDFDAGASKEVLGGHEVRFMDGQMHWVPGTSEADNPGIEYLKTGHVRDGVDVVREVHLNRPDTVDHKWFAGAKHLIGGGASLAQSWASIGAAVGGLVGTTALEVRDTIRQRNLAQNPMQPTPLSIRGDRAFDSGTNFEFTTPTTLVNAEQITEDQTRIVESNKERIGREPGSVWTLDGPGGTSVTVEVIGFETDPRTNQSFLRFNEIDSTTGNPIPSRSYLQYPGQILYINARHRANSLEEFRNVLQQERQAAQGQVMDQFRQQMEQRGFRELPQPGQSWEINASSTSLTNPAGGAVPVTVGQVVRVEGQLGNQPHVRITLFNSTTHRPDGTAEVTMQSLLENASKIDLGGGAQPENDPATNQLRMREINQILQAEDGSDLKQGAIWRVSATEWYYVDRISDSSGHMALKSGNMPLPAPIASKNKPALAALPRSPQRSIEDFLTLLRGNRGQIELLVP